MKPSIGTVVLHLKFYYYTYLLSFAEADRYCFCMYLSPQLFILSIHLEQAMAETTKKNHRRARPLTTRTLEGCWGAWPAWWGVNKQNTLCFQFAANPRASALGVCEGEGHQIWIIYNMLCCTFKRLCYVSHLFSKQQYNMSYIRVYNNLYMLHTKLSGQVSCPCNAGLRLD